MFTHMHTILFSLYNVITHFVACTITDCKVICHPKCAPDLPNTCGLPAELVDHVFSHPPSSKKAKMEEEEEEEEEEEPSSKVCRKEGWLQVFHPGV